MLRAESHFQWQLNYKALSMLCLNYPLPISEGLSISVDLAVLQGIKEELCACIQCEHRRAAALKGIYRTSKINCGVWRCSLQIKMSSQLVRDHLDRLWNLKVLFGESQNLLGKEIWEKNRFPTVPSEGYCYCLEETLIEKHVLFKG